MQELAQTGGFEVITGDTDSLLLLGKEGEGDERLQDFVNHCQRERSIEVEHQRTFSKFLSIKKKHYIGIDSVTGGAVVKGMEGKKSDRPKWVSRVFDQFVQDFKGGTVNPTINIKKATNDLESGRINPEDLRIYISLSKDPTEYAANNLQKRVGLYLGAKKGDVIYYYKTNSNSRKEKYTDIVPINPEYIDITEYKKMLFATLKGALEMLGIGDQERIKSDIFNISSNRDSKTSKNLLQQHTTRHEIKAQK